MPSVVTMTGPGTATITDDAALAIAAQTTALTASLALIQGAPGLPGTLWAIDANLFAIQKNLGAIADMSQSISSNISKMNISIGSLASAQGSANFLQAALTSNQIQTNNFQVQAATEALERAELPVPVPPPVDVQLKKIVVESVQLNALAAAEGAVSSFISSQAEGIKIWITTTAAYNTVSVWAEDAIKSLASFIPPSLRSAKNSASALAGVKDPS